MEVNEFLQTLPLILMAFSIVVLLFIIAVSESPLIPFVVTLCGFLCAFLSTVPLIAGSSGATPVNPFLVIDGYALFFIDLILVASISVSIMAHDYFGMRKENTGRYFVLLLTATLGAMVLISSSHFTSFFLGLETLSISLYGLIAYQRTEGKSVEAGIKYLVLSAFSTAFLLFGMALMYLKTGSMNLSAMSAKIGGLAPDPLVWAGASMTIAGIGFKLAIVPFHMWAPDVYEGAPVPTTAFIASVSKGAVFVLLLRYFNEIEVSAGRHLFFVFCTIAVASMFGGNILALFQRNIKRLLAYSSIAQFGYLLVAFLSTGTLRFLSIAYYLVAYFLSIIGAFAIVTVVSNGRKDADELDDYAGLFFRKPWLAATLSLMFLALAGIPLTMGLIAKFYVFAAGISSGLWFLAIVLAVNSVLGLFYYLRALSIMFRRPLQPEANVYPGASVASNFIIATFSAILIWWGIYPSLLTNIIRRVIGGA